MALFAPSERDRQMDAANERGKATGGLHGGVHIDLKVIWDKNPTEIPDASCETNHYRI
jgi:hypothetical protein